MCEMKMKRASECDAIYKLRVEFRHVFMSRRSHPAGRRETCGVIHAVTRRRPRQFCRQDPLRNANSGSTTYAMHPGSETQMFKQMTNDEKGKRSTSDEMSLKEPPVTNFHVFAFISVMAKTCRQE